MSRYVEVVEAMYGIGLIPHSAPCGRVALTQQNALDVVKIVQACVKFAKDSGANLAVGTGDEEFLFPNLVEELDRLASE